MNSNMVDDNHLLRWRLLIAFDSVSGLVGRLSYIGSGEPGEFGEHGSLCFRLPETLSMLHSKTQYYLQ